LITFFDKLEFGKEIFVGKNKKALILDSKICTNPVKTIVSSYLHVVRALPL